MWEGVKLPARQKCAEPRSDEIDAGTRGLRLTFMEVGPNADDRNFVDLATRVDVDNVPTLDVEAVDQALRIVMPQGPSVNTVDGVRWRVEGGSIEPAGDRLLVNELVLSFDDVGLGPRACRYGTLTLSGQVEGLGR